MHALTEKILILGGTREALRLARVLSEKQDVHVITSLAGRTREPDLPPAEIRVGGFGGAEGLAAYLRDENITLLVDATHPFAVNISKNANTAAGLAGVRHLMFARPEWRAQAGDRWEIVDSLEEAAGHIAPGATAFLALGRKHLAPFFPRDDVQFIVRMIDAPDAPLPFAAHELVLGKAGVSAEEEKALFEKYKVTCLICRNSGGEGAYAKLEAACMLKLPVLMLRRAPLPECDIFSDLDELMAHII